MAVSPIKKVIYTIAKLKGVKPESISTTDYLEEDLEMDDIDIDELLEVVSDYYDIDLGSLYEYDKHVQVKDIVKLINELDW